MSSSSEDDLFGENEEMDEENEDEDTKREEADALMDVNDDYDDDRVERERATREDVGANAGERAAVDGDGDGDIRMEDGLSSQDRHRSPSRSDGNSIPSNILRRQLFQPILPITPPSETPLISFDPFVVIPQPCPTHSLAATTCLSYLLTGSEDGYIRAYDFWASVNGKNLMTSQQKSMANLGDGVNKAGVPRGYWRNEFEVDEPVENQKELAKKEGGKKGASAFSWLSGSGSGSNPKPSEPVEMRRVRRNEPVYSLAIQPDGLWALQGGKSGSINLATVRHSPGTIAHVFPGGSSVSNSIQGHTKAISSLCLLPSETGFLSGSWDQTVKEWDLNTGSVVRTYTPHKAQISAVALRPVSTAPAVPSPVATPPPMEATGITISIGEEYEASLAAKAKTSDQKDKPDAEAAAVEPPELPSKDAESGDAVKADDDNDSSSDYGSLFGDEEEAGAGEGSVKVEKKEEPVPQPIPIKAPKSELPLPISKPAPPAPPAATLVRPKPVRQGLPVLTPATYQEFSEDVMLVASMDGEVALHDRRMGQSKVGKLETGEKTPPWCMSACWSSNGSQVIAGRRNFSLDVWDVRKMGRTGTTSTPSLLRNLKNPSVSREVSCVAAFPDGQHIACASYDTVRIWNTAQLWDPETSMKKKKSGVVPFRTIAGHHSGTVSSMLIDATGRFMITASGDRGWQGDSTKVVLVHELKQ